MNAVDTNVLVYAIDFSESDKRVKARELLQKLSESSGTVLLWQVLGEYMSCLRRFARAGRFPEVEIADDVEDLLTLFPLVVPREDVVRKSLRLTSAYSLSHWDSMLIAAAAVAGVETLYSEDLDAGMTYDSVTVVNPFL